MKAVIAVEKTLLKIKIDILLDNIEVNVLRLLIKPRKKDKAITAIKAAIGFCIRIQNLAVKYEKGIDNTNDDEKILNMSIIEGNTISLMAHTTVNQIT